MIIGHLIGTAGMQSPYSSLEHSFPPRRGVYLLPNLMTTAGLLSGFYAIITAIQGSFETAAIAIFIAIIADGLDGRLARLTHTATPFGAQYDSLSDMVSFGIAPALAMYSWSLHHLGQLGWLGSFLYTAATALRLARFNTQLHDNHRDYFQGLPCPSAAGLLASLLWVGVLYHWTTHMTAIVLLLTLFVAALMVSTIRYYSFKSMTFKGRVPFFTAVSGVLVLAAVACKPPEMLFSTFLIYGFSGLLITLWQLRKMRKQRSLERHSGL